MFSGFTWTGFPSGALEPSPGQGRRASGPLGGGPQLRGRLWPWAPAEAAGSPQLPAHTTFLPWVLGLPVVLHFLRKVGREGRRGWCPPPPHHPPPPQPDTGSLVPPQLCQAVVSLGTGATAGPLAGPRPAGPGRQLPACPLLPGSICSTDHEASARSCPGQEGHPASGLLRRGAKLFPSWGGWL